MKTVCTECKQTHSPKETQSSSFTNVSTAPTVYKVSENPQSQLPVKVYSTDSDFIKSFKTSISSNIPSI